MFGKYEDKSPEWRDALEKHLLKQEIIYVARSVSMSSVGRHEYRGGIAEPLLPYAGSSDAMLDYLKGIGFKIKRGFLFPEKDHRVYHLSDGVIVWTDNGFVTAVV